MTNFRICSNCSILRIWCPRRKLWWCANCGECKCPPHRDCKKCKIKNS